MADIPGTSSRLYGRDNELKRLVQAYENSTTTTTSGRCQATVLIRGKSGTGKSSLAYSLQEHVKRDSGYFLMGKFEIAATHDPYAVFVSAFNQFMEEILAEDNQDNSRISAIREAVGKAVGKEGGLLTGMIPSLERLLGHQDEVCNARGKEALNRLQFVFCNFCLAISSVAPLVIFLDDLQWGDSASLDLLAALAQSSEGTVRKSSLMVVGTFRDEGLEDDLNSPMKKPHESILARHLRRLDELSLSGSLQLTKIHLLNLDEAFTVELVATSLGISEGIARRLGSMIHSSCKGNPLHTLQMLRLLVSRKNIHLDNEDEHNWTWNEQDVLATIQSTKSVDQLVIQKLSSLPDGTQQILQQAACMGDEIDVIALATVSDGNSVPEIDLSLLVAANAGHVVLDRPSGRYRFVHDSVRQAILSMIEDADSMSFQIGYRLWTRSAPFVLNTKLFVVTNLLNHGITKIENQEERYKVAALNLEAGAKASGLADFPDSARYSRAGIALLEGGDYWNDRYTLTLRLYNILIDAEVSCQNFDTLNELANIVFKNARNVKDTLTAQVARINSLGQLGKVKEALEIGFEVVRLLGERLPESPWVSFKTKLALGRQSNETLLRLPPMEDEEKIASMHILSILAPYAFFAGSKYPPILGTKLAHIFLSCGIHKYSSVGMLAYGWALCHKDGSEGYRFGRLALAIVEKYRARELIPRVHVPFYGLIHHWKRPLKESVDLLSEVERIAMELGDVEQAFYALRFKCNHGFWSGMPLGQVERLLVEGMRGMKLFKQLNLYHISTPFLQYIHNLTGRAHNPKILSGEAVGLYNPSDKVESMSVPNVHYIFGMDLAYLFGDYEQAKHIMERRHSLKFEPFGTYPFAACRFKETLICIAAARGSVEKRKYLKIARINLMQIRRWAKDCPDNFLHKQRLVEAEMWGLKSSSKSMTCCTHVAYDDSIKCALRQGFLQEAALASELCGDFLLRQGDMREARRYWDEAGRLYAEWGATEKAAQLSLRIAS